MIRSCLRTDVDVGVATFPSCGTFMTTIGLFRLNCSACLSYSSKTFSFFSHPSPSEIFIGQKKFCTLDLFPPTQRILRQISNVLMAFGCITDGIDFFRGHKIKWLSRSATPEQKPSRPHGYSMWGQDSNP